MRFPNQRLAQLFAMLQNETLPQDELAQRLSVSTRTVRADIAALNMLLTPHGAQFTLSRGNGYQLKIDDPARYQSLQTQQSPAPARGPRTSRADTLFAGAFLTSAFSLKLEDLADEWFVSRATLQNDMADVREHLLRYHLTLETRPRHGMKLFGGEMAIRACLTDLLWTLAQQEPSHPLIVSTTLNTEVSQRLRSLLPDIFSHCQIRLTDEGELFLRLYCAVAVRRIREGYPLSECVAEEVDEKVRHAAHEIAELLQQLADKPLSEPEVSWLKVHIAARRYRRLPQRH